MHHVATIVSKLYLLCTTDTRIRDYMDCHKLTFDNLN